MDFLLCGIWGERERDAQDAFKGKGLNMTLQPTNCLPFNKQVVKERSRYSLLSTQRSKEALREHPSVTAGKVLSLLPRPI